MICDRVVMHAVNGPSIQQLVNLELLMYSTIASVNAIVLPLFSTIHQYYIATMQKSMDTVQLV